MALIKLLAPGVSYCGLFFVLVMATLVCLSFAAPSVANKGKQILVV